MNISDSYAALAELYARFGKGADPKEAWAQIDAMIAGLQGANVGLQLMFCAVAFDHGTLLGLIEKVRESERLLCAEHLDAFLALPSALEVSPTPPPERRIITTH